MNVEHICECIDLEDDKILCLCWCKPKIEYIGDNAVVVHKSINQERTEKQIKPKQEGE